MGYAVALWAMGRYRVLWGAMGSLCGSAGLCVALWGGAVGLCAALWGGAVGLYRALHGSVRLCVALWGGTVWLYRALWGSVWLCGALRGAVGRRCGAAARLSARPFPP